MPPKFRQLAAELRNGIAAGDYPAGSYLPPVAQLAAERGMGKQTVSEAVKLLEAEGLVHAATRTGILVLDQRPVPVALSRYLTVMQPGGDRGPWETACHRIGIPGRMDLIEVGTMPAEDDVAEALELPPAQRRIVRRYRRAMLGDPEQAVQLHTASYPARLVRGTPMSGDGKIEGGVYGAFTAAGIPPVTATETVGTRPATDEEYAELNLRGNPVLTVERITRDAGRRPIELLQIVADPSRAIFVYDNLPLSPAS